MFKMEGAEEDTCVVRVRGLPWSCTDAQLREFFNEDEDDRVVVCHFTYNREGRPSGEAYVKFTDNAAYESALRKDKEYLNKRYVEVFPAKQSEMDYVVSHSGRSSISSDSNDNAVVRMRGLPFGCTKEEIASFFLGLEIAPNGIVMLSDMYARRPSGEAFVQFLNKDAGEKALQKHMQKIGHRYIEVFRSSTEEMRRITRRMGVFSSGGGMQGGGYGEWSDESPMYRMPSMGMSSPYGEFYASRLRPTPYERPAYSSRPRPTPLAAVMTGAGMSGYRGLGGMGRMAGIGGSHKGSLGSYGSAFEGGRGGRMGSGHYVHMRGIPYSTVDADIVDFFKPLRIAAVDIVFDKSGRPAGEADVEFYTHNDAVEAMKHDRQTLGHRYVELFLNSSASGRLQFQGYRDFAEDFM